MSDVEVPDRPGWYADAAGAWWWWDGAGWTPGGAAPRGRLDPAEALAAERRSERSTAVVVWVLTLVAGFIGPLIFYFVSGPEKRFVRHHVAEALNLAIVMFVPQVIVGGLAVYGMFDFVLADVDRSPGDPAASPPVVFFVAIGLSLVLSIANLVYTVVALVKANGGQWWRLPIGVHPVRGVLPKGAEPPYSVA